MRDFWRLVIVAQIGVALLGVTAPVPSSRATPTSGPLAVPTVAPSDAALMRVAIDSQLATFGYGRLCIVGPQSFPAKVDSDDEDAALELQVKQLLDIGFIRVTLVRTVADRVTETQYDLTQAGARLYTTYRRLGFGGDLHGWCYAEYRVGSIVSSESGPFCRQPSRLLTGFAEPEPRCVTIVSYAPKILSSADWLRLPQAKVFSLDAEVAKVSQAIMTATLVSVGSSWEAATSALDVVPLF